MENAGHTLVYRGRGANTFDQVWRTPSGEYIIVEVKGGSAAPTSSRIWRSGDGRRYQEGTVGYMESIIRDSLAEEGGRLPRPIATELEAALESDRLAYVEVSQPLGDPGEIAGARTRTYWSGER